MENKLQVFTSPEFGELQTLEVNGKIFFPATRTAEILGYQNPQKAIRDHCLEKGVNVLDTPSNGGIQRVKYISEGNLYRLIIRSKLPSAQRFESWVFDEILPSIRKNGFYIDPKREIDPDVVINLCNQIKEQRRKIELMLEDNQILEQQVRELSPKASYYDLILNCKDLVSVSEIAKDYGLTAKRLNEILKDLNVQYQLPGQRTWLLKSKYAGKGYTGSKTHDYLGSDGENHTKMHTYWTQAGRLFIYDLLKAHGILPIIEQAEQQTSIF